MALENIASKLVGWVAKLPKEEAYNIANEAWLDIRNNRLWSFQLGEDSINTPAVVNSGFFSTTLGSNTVTADAVASAAITGLNTPFITQRQFRVQGLSIYSIINADFTVPTAVVLTLDRVYSDPTGTGPAQPYQIFQAYFAAPVADFKRYIDWRDMINGFWLDVHSTRREMNMGDPQRLYYDFPYWVVGFQSDQRGAGTPFPSSTLGYPMHELYPNPLAALSYMRWWVRTGADLVNPSDTVPYPMTDKLVSARARMLAYQWAEGNRDATIPRGQVADYKFLYQAAEKEFNWELRIIGLKDRDLVDMFVTRIVRLDNTGRRLPYYSSLLGRAYAGA